MSIILDEKFSKKKIGESIMLKKHKILYAHK
jgi:hypothetical protein